MKKTLRIKVLLSLVLLSTVGVINFSSSFDSNTPISTPLMSGSEQSGLWTVGYNDYLQRHAVANESIRWEFECIPNSVRMLVLIVDEDSYTSFVSDVGNSNLSSTVYSPAFVSSIISENRVNDSGNFLIPHWSIWYVVFVNLDKTCQLKYRIEFDWNDYIYDDTNDESFIPIYPHIFIVSVFAGIFCSVLILLCYLKDNKEYEFTS